MSLLICVPVLGNGDPNDHDQMAAKIKVAYIYNLLRFVVWPDDAHAIATDPIKICALCSSSFHTFLSELDGRMMKGRPIEVTFLTDITSLPPCHLLFIGAGEEENVPVFLQKMLRKPVLIVLDHSLKKQQGVMIGFTIEDQRVIVELNLNQLRLAGLTVSVKLLKIARIVE